MLKYIFIMLTALLFIGCGFTSQWQGKTEQQIDKERLTQYAVCLERGHIKESTTHPKYQNIFTGIVDNDTISYSERSTIICTPYHCLRCGKEWTESDTVNFGKVIYWSKP